ncbi:MAG: clostripain-related cysteine peptidase [Deltaproteobacteria bacterium]|nr:clostripain-related cysteine peptidase [Deltaproteobacteria bacterium]
MKRILSVLFYLLAFGLFLPQYAKCADWTFMVYLDGDNNLEDAGIDDFLEMSSVGSDSNVNIVVQFDRIPGEDSSFDNWTDCQRFLVTAGMTPTVANAISDWGDGTGGREVNMADPQTLIDFIKWSMDNYPARNYAVILWNHGGGWRVEYVPERPILRAVCWDDTSGGDSLYMSEVKSALNTIKTERQQVDLAGFDACLMSMTEVAYEIKDLANVMVASEASEPGDGWPYDTIIEDLSALPTMSATDLGATIVNRYGESYGSASETTQSAIDLSIMDTIASCVNDLAAAMDSNKSEITAARAGSQEYNCPENIDLYHFADLLYIESSDPDIQTTAFDVMTAVESAVIAEYHGTWLPNSHGLAIYFPETETGFDSDYNGSIIDFPADTQWDEFLSWYYSATDEITLLTPDNGAVLPESPPATFAWEADSTYRFKLEFSPTSSFVFGFPTLTVPRQSLMTYTSTDAIQVDAWQRIWKIIKRMEQINGIIYWRVLGKPGPTAPEEPSEIRNFMIQ